MFLAAAAFAFAALSIGGSALAFAEADSERNQDADQPKSEADEAALVEEAEEELIGGVFREITAKNAAELLG